MSSKNFELMLSLEYDLWTFLIFLQLVLHNNAIEIITITDSSNNDESFNRLIFIINLVQTLNKTQTLKNLILYYKLFLKQWLT